MQVKLDEGKLLTNDGELTQTGYATKLVKSYNRKDIKAKKSRIRESNYYFLANSTHGISLLIGDYSYYSIFTLSLFDLTKNEELSKSSIKLFSNGKLCLPSKVKDEFSLENKKVKISSKFEDNKIHLLISWKKFKNDKDVRADLYLEPQVEDSIVTCNSLNKPLHFNLSQKINLLKGNGYLKFGEEILDFNLDTYGVIRLDRGALTRKNTSYWASMSGVYEGKKVGFNLGYSLLSNPTHTENIFYYGDKSYKLEDVHFDIPINKHGSDSYLEPWKFRSVSKDISLSFTPLIYKKSGFNALIFKEENNLVIGKYSGYILVDGKEYFFSDMLGFAKKVINKW